LVGLKTSLTGNVSYRTQDIEPERVSADGAMRAKWETEKTVRDAAEQERGIKARSDARTIVTRLCSATGFGLLCPETRADELAAAIAQARTIAARFNETATITCLNVGVIVGRVADNDQQAVKAINGEVRELLADMDAGIRSLDVKAVREAADKARALGQMLTPNAAERVQVAIDAARRVARRMVKAGEQAAREIDQATLRAIASARTAFLDLDTPAEPAAPLTYVDASARALDLEPEESNLPEGTPAQITAPAPAIPQFELL
jgi:hypothetical protein